MRILRCFPKPDRVAIVDRLKRVADSVPMPDDEGVLSASDADFVAGLKLDVADALSQIVQLLACGEESAVHVFYREGDRIGMTGEDSLLHSQSVMYRIAKEETVHDLMLTRLAKLLPYDDRHLELRKKARHFYMSYAHRDPKLHFFRISELDSVVCMIMHAMLTGTGQLGPLPLLSCIGRRIRTDEATHVRVTHDHVKGLGMTLSERIDEADPIREKIVGMLSSAREAFEIMGVDSDRLFARILSRKVS